MGMCLCKPLFVCSDLCLCRFSQHLIGHDFINICVCVLLRKWWHLKYKVMLLLSSRWGNEVLCILYVYVDAVLYMAVVIWTTLNRKGKNMWDGPYRTELFSINLSKSIHLFMKKIWPLHVVRVQSWDECKHGLCKITTKLSMSTRIPQLN